MVFAASGATLVSLAAQPLLVGALSLEAARLRRQRLQLFLLGRVLLGAVKELFGLLARRPGAENALVLAAPLLQLQLLLLHRVTPLCC